MSAVQTVLDLVLHLDRSLRPLADSAGPWIYLILFLVIFAETGLVVTPFLPGDSLLFMAGTLAGAGILGFAPTALVLFFAAVLGDTVNYHAGRWIGPKVFHRPQSRWLKQEHLASAQRFYQRWGGRAVVLGRFVPVVRTFVPFVAGIGAMAYVRFLVFNLVGALVWVAGFLSAGFLLGGLPLVRENLGLLSLGIVAVSVVPVVLAGIQRQTRRLRTQTEAPPTSQEPL